MWGNKFNIGDHIKHAAGKLSPCIIINKDIEHYIVIDDDDGERCTIHFEYENAWELIK